MKKTVMTVVAIVVMLLGSTFISRAESGELITPPVLFTGSSCPTTGNVRALVVQVDFPDNTFEKSVYMRQKLEDMLFGEGKSDNYPYETMTAYYERASYGNLHIDGAVYAYTAKNDMSYYESESIDIFAKEVIEALDDQIDYRNYDVNDDGVLDLVIFNVPSGGDYDFWYSATNYWSFGIKKCDVDDCTLYQYIVVDDQPYYYDMKYFTSVLCHETGHTMGLPDYYLYDVDDDWEGYTGEMGNEIMDEGNGDFSSFSKLMLGWLTEDEIQIYTGGEQEFFLSDASKEGSCLIIPRHPMKSEDFLNEYFVVEYVTKVNNNCRMHSSGGIRIYHVEASPDRKAKLFRYENFSRFYDSSHEGARVTRLVNDGGSFGVTGDVVTDGASNFAWYDRNGQQVFQVRLKICIGENMDGRYRICVRPNNSGHNHRKTCRCGK